MANGHGGNQGAAVAAKGGAHLTPDGHLEEILNSISPEEGANFKDHLEYRSPENRARMRYEQFVNVTGGTEKMFDDVYHNTYKVGVEKELKGKTDPKSVADTLELVVIEALKKIERPHETFLWKNFESMKANRGFESDEQRLGHLQMLAQYLGADQEEIGQLMAGLQSGEALLWNQSVREFTNKLKDGMVDRYVTQHRTQRVNQDNEHKFKAYAANRMRETHHVTPKNLPRYLSPANPVSQALVPLSQLELGKSPQAYAGLGLQEYKPPAKKDSGHGGR